MRFESVLGNLRYRFFPSKKQKIAKRWRMEGGDFQKRYEYDLSRESLVFDIGGYLGDWTSEIYSRYRCNIMIFEPVEEFADAISNRFSNIKNIHVFQIGLGGYTRDEIIAVSENASSIFMGSKGMHHMQNIRVVDIAEWISERDIGEISLMKVNIEGAEYELIERIIESNIIVTVKDLQIQFHEINKKSRSRMRKIQKNLEVTHYPTYQYEFVWENWTRHDIVV